MSQHPPAVGPRIPFRILEVLPVILLLMPVLLAAGYHGAFGQSDPSGRPIGFNHPVLHSHLPVMARALTLDRIWVELWPWVFPALVFQAAGPWIPFLPRRARGVHAVGFLLGMTVVVLSGAHSPRGECIVEGEWSTAMALLVWAGAWLPAAMVAVAGSGFLKAIR